MNLQAAAVLCVAALGLSGGTASGQATPDLPVMGALTYRLLFHGDSLPVGRRFAGRIGLRLSSGAYAGLSIGSWATYRDCGREVPPGCRDTDYQVLEYQAFGQFYVTPRFYVRAGAGYAEARTISPATSRSLLASVSGHPALSTGLGWGHRLVSSLSADLTIDYMWLVDASLDDGELERALTVGLSLTLR